MRAEGSTGAAVAASTEFTGLTTTYSEKPPKPTGLAWAAIAPKDDRPDPTRVTPSTPAPAQPRQRRAPTRRMTDREVADKLREQRQTPRARQRQAAAPRRSKRQDRHTAVVEAYEALADRTLDEVLAEVGMSAKSLRRHVQQAGMAWRYARDGGNVDVLVEQYRTGRTVVELAAEHSISDNTVRRRLRAAGVQLRDDRDKRVDVPNLVAQYARGRTVPELAQLTGHSRPTIRARLRAAGVELRDDRATRSGGRPKVYPTDLVESVRSLYGQGLTQAQVGDRLGVSTKVVHSVMVRAGIEARPQASEPGGPGVDRAAPLRARMVATGTTAAMVRSWAARTGIACPPLGPPPAGVVEAYLNRLGYRRDRPLAVTG